VQVVGGVFVELEVPTIEGWVVVAEEPVRVGK
jgi:hypothetical protein